MVPLVRQMIRKEADVYAVDNNGENLLMAAAESQNIQMMQLMTPQYFSIDSVDREGKTPLMYSTKKGTKALEIHPYCSILPFDVYSDHGLALGY